MSIINGIFERLQNLSQKEGQSDFSSVLIANNNESEHENNSVVPLNSYKLLHDFLRKIFKVIDELSTEILKNDSILISVKDQKTLRTCFQIITSLGVSICLIPGLGIPLSKRCLTLTIIPQLNFKDEEKYELLVDCTNFFTRSYKVPVLKNIISTLHFSDYLAALIQLAFAPLKKPGTYPNFTMTEELFNKLTVERQKFIIQYEYLVTNCFQPILMKELLVLQSASDPPPPAFVKKNITKELSRRLLAPGGLLSLIRCFIESYNIDTGLEWKKIDMLCKIICTKHGGISENEYLENIASQLMKILSMNNTHYLTTAMACVLSLNDNFPESPSVQFLVKDIFQAFIQSVLVSKCDLPGTVILSAQEVEHKVKLLHTCVCMTKLDWPVELLAPNLHILFTIGVKCTKNEELKTKIKDILLKCLEKLECKEISSYMIKFLFDKNDYLKHILVEEYDAGIIIKSTTQERNNSCTHEELSYFLNLFRLSTEDKLVKTVFESSLGILVDLSVKRRSGGNKDLFILEEEPVLLDTTDTQYAVILQLLSEMSSSPKMVTILKNDPFIVVNFIEYFLSETNSDLEECTTIALVLLNTVLANMNKDSKMEKRLVSITPKLKMMAKDKTSFNHILCKEALSLMTSEKCHNSNSAYEKAIADVFDNLLPVRAHGIMELTKLIDAKDAETVSKKHYIICLFQEQLKDSDSYIYLSAINGLASLCTHCTEDVLQTLCQEFLQMSTDQENMKTYEGNNKVAELRMKIGDVIVKVTKRLGEIAVVHKTILLNTMLCGCRDDDPLIRTSSLSNLAEIALVLHYKMGAIIYEVLLCIWGIIETDKAVECRRAAVMVISSLLKGLGKDTIIQLKENILPIYRTLKSLYRDTNEDAIVKLHAQIALEELNEIVNNFIFPEVKMEKQLYVLDKPQDIFK